MDYGEANFILQLGALLAFLFWGYVFWAGDGFEFLRPGLENSRWGTRKLARFFGLRRKPTGPTNDFVNAPSWMTRNR